LSSKNTSYRIEHLDACRGIAATFVVASHCLQSVDIDKQWSALRVALGHIPVVFFFVLSGYVLGRSLLKARIDARFYAAYSIKRFFRLVPLLVVVFFGSFITAKFINPNGSFSIPVSQWAVNLSNWMAQVTTMSQFLENILLIQRGLNIPTWTIKIELVCSLALPFLVLVLRRNRILAIFTLLVFSFMGSHFFGQIFGLNGGDITLIEAIRYTYLFLFGFTLCGIEDFFSEQRKLSAVALLFISTMALLWSIWVPWGEDLTQGVLITGIMAVLIPLPFPMAKVFLSARIPVVLGNLSYGIYLFHTPVLLFLIAGPVTPWLGPSGGAARFPWLFVQVFILTLAFSFLANKCVEFPLNRLGHRLASLISGRKARSFS
jgi:peptidoglycan/LPS O-acetylase OafA/YrhL